MASCQLHVYRAWSLHLPARYYADPKAKAAHIKNHVAFYKVSLHIWHSDRDLAELVIPKEQGYDRRLI